MDQSVSKSGASSAGPNNRDALLESAEQAIMASRQGRKLAVAMVIGRLLCLLLRKFWAISAATFLILLLLYWFYGGLVTLAFLLFAIAGVLYNAQDMLLYYPDQPHHSRIYVESPNLLRLPFENIFVKAKDGVTINMMLIKQLPPLMGMVPTVIFFHGNAGNIGHRLPNAYALYTSLRVNVLLVEYRGYGKSTGKPSESGIDFHSGFTLDAQAAFDYISERSDINQQKLIVFGRSLGGAVAIRLASLQAYTHRVHCLVVENTFTSLPDIGRHIFDLRLLHYLPVWCFKNKYPSLQRIEKLMCPTMFLSGQADSLIPPLMMEKLYQLSSSSMKRIARFPGGTHNETWQCSGYYESINRFLVELAQTVHEKPVQNAASYTTNIPFDDGGAFTL